MSFLNNPGQVIVNQQGNPNVSPPSGAASRGDVVIQTSDGTSNGSVVATWIWDGTKWQQTGYNPTAIAAPAASPRSYYPSNPQYFDYNGQSSPTAAQITAQGFTPIGGATATTGSVYAGNGLIDINAVAPSITTQFTIPTSYIRHEVAVTPASDNTYFIKAIADRETCLEVWVCDKTSGIPLLRLAAKGVSAISNQAKTPIQLSPKEESGSDGNVFEWFGFEIPKAIVVANITGTGTLKLAIRPAPLNGNGNISQIAGWAVAQSSILYTVSNCFSFDNQLNGGGQLLYTGLATNAYWTIGANATVNAVRVPIPDVTKDCYLTLVAPTNTGGSRAQYADTTIAHPSGNVRLFRPKPHVKAPIADASQGDSDYGLYAAGWIIPAATLAAKAVTPANSAVSYLELNIRNTNQSQLIFGFGFVMEAVN
jgi:hypothetical protein